MTVQHDEAIVTAAHVTHDKVWHAHWKEGERQLRPAQVIGYVRDIRTTANVTEERLPAPLLELLQKARDAEKTKTTLSLADLVVALKRIILPPATA